VIKGRKHRFMYRAKNVVGWGPYSEPAFVLAARVPSVPSKPYFLGFKNDELLIVVPKSLDNGGTPILWHELWVDDGNALEANWRNLTGFANELVYKATAASDLLVLGQTYRFISRSINEIGYSSYSIYAYIAFGPVPEPP